mgnify:CR=1 FL=1
MSEASNPERGPVAAQTLDGGWFRKERERIAVGRKGMALRLGSTESKVTTLETRKHDVPTEWFAVLRELGFRFPADVAQAETPVASVVTDVAQAAAIPSPPSDVPVVIAAEFAVSASDPPSASADAVIEAVVIEAEGVERGREHLGARGPTAGVLAQRGPDHRVERGRDRAVGAAQRHRDDVVVELAIEHRGRRAAAERRRPGQHLVDDHADGVEVGGRGELVAADLLRRHVLRGPRHAVIDVRGARR